MKKLQAIILIALFSLTFISCKKNNDLELPADASLGIQSTENMQASTWKESHDWTSSNEADYKVFTTNFVADIDSDVMANGLIRVFKASATGENIKSLPYTDTIQGTKYEWYYHVSEG